MAPGSPEMLSGKEQVEAGIAIPLPSLLSYLAQPPSLCGVSCSILAPKTVH